MKSEHHETPPAIVAFVPKQAGETPSPWDWVERCVWTERMLSRLTSSEPANRVWFSLMDKTYAAANLRSAWEQVRRNRGSAGVDRQSIQQFASRAEAELAWLERQLREQDYRPHPVRRAWIDKPGSTEQRPLGIPAVRDRIVQTALKHVLEPIFESEFAEHSYGFRPGRGAKDALRRVDQLLKAGAHWVVDADLRRYFDTIPQEKLLALMRTRVADGRVLALVEAFLQAGVMEEGQDWQPTESGTPQGGVISPLLANVYLNALDQLMAGRGYEMVRYADDFVILCRSQAEAETALEMVQTWVAEAGLSLHPTKTRLVDATQPGGFDFLGYHFERGRKWPRKKSWEGLKEKVRAKTRRNDGRSLKEIIDELNRTLQGWYGYFQHSRRTTFEMADGFVRRRLRSLLETRRGRTRHGRGLAHRRWPNAWFARQGLLSLVEAHVMTVTIVSLRTH